MEDHGKFMKIQDFPSNPFSSLVFPALNLHKSSLTSGMSMTGQGVGGNSQKACAACAVVADGAWAKFRTKYHLGIWEGYPNSWMVYSGKSHKWWFRWVIWGYPHFSKPPFSKAMFIWANCWRWWFLNIYEIKWICSAIYSVFGGRGKDIKHSFDNCKFERCAASCSLSCEKSLLEISQRVVMLRRLAPYFSRGRNWLSIWWNQWRQESSLQGRFWKRVGPGRRGEARDYNRSGEHKIPKLW